MINLQRPIRYDPFWLSTLPLPGAGTDHFSGAGTDHFSGCGYLYMEGNGCDFGYECGNGFGAHPHYAILELRHAAT